MQLALRHGVYGGWHGLGDVFEDFTDFQVTPPALPDWGDIDPATGRYFSDTTTATDLTSTDLTGYLQTIGVKPNASGQLVDASGRKLTGPQLQAIAGAITKLAQTGIKAVAPNSSTGACPTGYVMNGLVCTPGSGAAAGAQLIPGIPNQTLAIIGLGVLALVMITGGKKR